MTGTISGLTIRASFTPENRRANNRPKVLGNRTIMDIGGVSEITNQYDSLSRMTRETVDFDDLTANRTIGYTYHPGGALKSITNPDNTTIQYVNDKSGRLTAVTGTPWGPNTTGKYVENIKYRAFGSIKQLDYTLPDETPQIKIDYDSRLRAVHSEVTTDKMTSGYMMRADYGYSADSRLQAKNDFLDDKLDQTMKYDFAGRMTFNQFGMGAGTGGVSKRVYQQSISYDAFSTMTSRNTVYWGEPDGFTESLTNGRVTNNPNIRYDAAGNIVDSNANAYNAHDYQRTNFDASGKGTISHSSTIGRMGNRLNMVTEIKNQTVYDGDGRPVVQKTGSHIYHSQTGTPPPTGWLPSQSSYQIWSTVLGASLMTIEQNGDLQETKVYAGGALVAKNSRYAANNRMTDNVTWTTADPVSGTKGTFGFSGTSGSVETEEHEPLGQKLTLIDPASPEFPEFPPNEKAGSADDPHWQCEAGKKFWGERFVGMPFHCQKKALYESGAFLPWEDEKPENPIMINSYSPKIGSPTNNSMSDAMLTYALKATTKKTKDDKKECPVVNGVATCDEPVGSVDVRSDPPSPVSVSEFEGAEKGGTVIPVFFKDNADAITALSETVSKGDCGTMLEKLFGNLKTTDPTITFSNPVRSADVLLLFKNLAEQKEGGLFVNSSEAEAMAQFKKNKS